MAKIIIGKEFGPTMIPLIKRTKDTIDIMVYSWYWYPDQIGSEIQKFNNAVIDAAKRGVKVKILANDYHTINVLLQNKVKAKKLKTKRKLHAKLMILDGKIAILGSHNYTMGAFATNYEVSITTQEKEVVNRLKQFFSNLWWS